MAARTINIKWPQLDITIAAAMDDKNPRLVDLLFKNLPYRSLQNHALVSGDHLYHLVPSEQLIYTTPDYKVSNRVHEPDGTVFLSGLQHLAIKYGPLTEYLPAAPCGRVLPEHMEKLRAVGTGVWNACSTTKEAIEVIVWDASTPEPAGPVPLIPDCARISSTDEVRALVDSIHAETEKSWSGLSSDLQTVHKGLAPSLAGSKHSYFATMVFINGEIRPLGYNILNGILKVAATQHRFDLDHLITLFRTFASVPSEFVGYTGAAFLWESYQKINSVVERYIRKNLDEHAAREDFLALVSAFARYVNLLNAQNLHLFPWRHGVEYPILGGN
ncbi:cucumopine synthase [Aspergillus unguis]